MAYEAKDGDFSLFKNNKKTEDKHPDYTGKAIINGETMYISAWLKQRDGGDVFFSGRIEPKRETGAGTPVPDPFNPSAGTTAKTAKKETPMSDDLPF